MPFFVAIRLREGVVPHSQLRNESFHDHAQVIIKWFQAVLPGRAVTRDYAAGQEDVYCPVMYTMLFGKAGLAVGETVILLHPPLTLVGVSIGIKRECQQNDSLADGKAGWPAVQPHLSSFKANTIKVCETTEL